MWEIDVKQIQGQVIRPAPMGTEVHQCRCLVYESPESKWARYSVVTVKGKILTAKTLRGLRGKATRAGLVWSERFYTP